MIKYVVEYLSKEEIIMRIKNMLLTVLSIIFLIVISSCGESDIELAHLDYKEIEIEKPNFDVTKRNTKDEVTYSDLFNLGNQVTISIEMEDSELNKLQMDYESFKETYCRSFM